MEILRDVSALRTILGAVVVAFIAYAVYLSAAVSRSRPRAQPPTLAAASRRRGLLILLGPVVFLMSYLGVLTLLGIYAELAAEASPVPRPDSSRQLWHEAGSGSLPLFTSILWINALAVVYLWLTFRSYRESTRGLGRGLVAFYVAGVLLLLLLQFYFWGISGAAADGL